MEQLVDEITCVAAFGSRVFTGDASGAVRCYDAIASESNSNRETEPAAGIVEAEATQLVLSAPLWEAHGVTQRAISVRKP